MILSLIPALFTGPKASPTTPPPASAATAAPNGGPGFAALFLALLGGGATPDGSEGDGEATVAGDAETGQGESKTTSGAAFSTPVGQTTTAGWAALGIDARGGDPSAEGNAPMEPDADSEAAGAVDAASAPATAAAALAEADVRTPNRALSELDPELRAKVERVIDRMAAEHGRTVAVVEGHRSAERQQFLYEQGRTRPGPVVTWTKSSLHMEGRAADLKIEGPWSQRGAYAQLQKVAAEEGLGTLGMKDPGHVELKGDGAAAIQETAAADKAPLLEDFRSRGVARPARVARVAAVARPAAVPTPGATVQGAGATIAAPAAVPTPVHEMPAELQGSAMAATADRVASDSRRRGSSSAGSEGTRDFSSLVGDTRSASASTVANASAVAGVPGADPMAQVDRIMEVREAMSTINPQRVSVRMDGTAGPVDRIQVDLLDKILRGRVDVDDPGLAQRLRGDVSEVLRSLGEKGYDAQSMAVRMATGTSEAGRDGLGAWLRPDGAAQAMRTILGAQASANGRDAQQERPEGQPQRDDPNQSGSDPHSSRQNRRQDR